MSDLFEASNQDDDLFGNNNGEDFSSFLQQPLSKQVEERTELVSEMQVISLSTPAVDNQTSTPVAQEENDQQEENNQIVPSSEIIKEEPQTLQEKLNSEPVNNDSAFHSTGEDDLFGGSTSNVQDFGSMILMQQTPLKIEQVQPTQEMVTPIVQTSLNHESNIQQPENIHPIISSPPPTINTFFPPSSVMATNQSTITNNSTPSTLSPPPLRSASSTSSISSRNRYVNSFGTQSRSTFTLPVSSPPTLTPTSTNSQIPPVIPTERVVTNNTHLYGNLNTNSVSPQFPPVTNGNNMLTQQVPNHFVTQNDNFSNQHSNSHNMAMLNNGRSAVMEGYSSSPPPFHGTQTPTQFSTPTNGLIHNPMINEQMVNNSMMIPPSTVTNQNANYMIGNSTINNMAMGNMVMNNGQMINNYGMMNSTINNTPVNLIPNNMNNSMNMIMNQPFSNSPVMNNSMNQYMNPMMMNNPMMQRSISPNYQQNQIISRQILDQEIELRKTYPKPIFCFSFGGKIISSLPTINPHSQPSNIFIHQQRTQALHYQPGLFKVQKLNQLINYRSSIIKSLEDYPITNISQQFDENSSNNINVLLDQLVKYMNLKIYEKQQALIQDNDEKCMGEKMLWDLVKIVSKYVNGNVNMVNSDINSLLTVLINNVPSELPINSENEQSSFNETEHVVNIQNLLINGQIKQACQYAQTNKMWSHAILLSSMIDKQTYQQVVSTFAKLTLNLGSPLRTLYCTFAGKPLEAFESNNSVNVDQYGNQYTLQSSQGEQQQLEKMSSQWLQNLSIMFNNRQGATSQSVIEKIGDMLWKDCYQVPQSHFCYMIGDLSAIISAFTIASNYQAATSSQAAKENIQQQSQQAMISISNILSTSIVNKRVILLGGDNKRDLRHYINEETIQLSEIFELLKAIITKNCLTAVQEQNVPPISMIINSSLLTYKLVYAYYLADFGFLEKANECCDYLIDIVKKTQQSMKFNNYFKLHLQELKNRIIESNRLNNIIVPQRKPTSGAGNNSGVTGWFMKGLESIIHGGDSPTTLNESTTTLIQTNVINTNSMIPNNNLPQQSQPTSNFIIGQNIRSSTPTNMISNQPSYQPTIQTPPPSNHTPQPYLQTTSIQTPPPTSNNNTPPPSNNTPPVNQGNNSTEEGSGVGGWFKSLWGGSKKEANIGKKNEYYYDETKKRWVRRGQENEVEAQTQAPPPSLSAISATTLQSAATQMRGGAGRYVNMFSGGQQQTTSTNPPMMPNMPPPSFSTMQPSNIPPTFFNPVVQ